MFVVGEVGPEEEVEGSLDVAVLGGGGAVVVEIGGEDVLDLSEDELVRHRWAYYNCGISKEGLSVV